MKKDMKKVKGYFQLCMSKLKYESNNCYHHDSEDLDFTGLKLIDELQGIGKCEEVYFHIRSLENYNANAGVLMNNHPQENNTACGSMRLNYHSQVQVNRIEQQIPASANHRQTQSRGGSLQAK